MVYFWHLRLRLLTIKRQPRLLLLCHQMEQLLKLKKELSEGKKEVEVMRTDIEDMEKNLHQQEIIMKSQPNDKKVVRILF